jgi:hypothetical protein
MSKRNQRQDDKIRIAIAWFLMDLKDQQVTSHYLLAVSFCLLPVV